MALERQKVERTGKTLLKECGLPFRIADADESMRSKFTGTVQLESDRFAVVETHFEMQIVPWRLVIDKQLGREVLGVIREGGGIEGRSATR